MRTGITNVSSKSKNACAAEAPSHISFMFATNAALASTAAGLNGAGSHSGPNLSGISLASFTDGATAGAPPLSASITRVS
jgi:hypothetical protein